MTNVSAPNRLPAILLALYAVYWCITAINPLFPHDWMLENMLVALALPTVIVVHRHGSLSNGAWIAMFAFFLLHSTGAHYTYAEVPYDRWWQALTGHTFNETVGWQRNNFDRVVHFAYGLLLTPAFTELLGRVAPARSRAWMYVVAMSVMGMQAMLYELIEWAAAMIVAPELGAAYLGMQGDVWDAQEDMAMATLGTAISLALMWWRGKLPVAR